MSHHSHVMQKIVTLPDLQQLLQQRRREAPLKVVFSNGCFDLIHRGHVDYLSRARDLGDLLVVGLNSDASVRRLKGPSRPIAHEESRALVLAAMEFVDYVVLFDDDTPLRLIEALLPDVLVKGADYQRADVVGADVVEAHGGEVVLLSLVAGESTTILANRIQASATPSGTIPNHQ